MNGNLTRIDAFDPKKQALWNARLGHPFRHQWPLVPAGCKGTLLHFGDPLDTVLKSHAKKGEWLVELDASEQTEASFAKMLARVGAAKVKRLAIVNVPADWKRGWLAKVPASVEQLRLDLWQASEPDFAPLAKLPALRSLGLFGPYNDGKTVDLSVLAKCAALAQLSLQIPHVKLAAPPSLVELDMRGVETLETKPLTLKMLSIVTKVPREKAAEAAIAAQIAVAAPGLEELIVHANVHKLDKLDKLAIPATLRQLTLKIDSRNAISLKPLANLTGLERLSLQGRFKQLDTLSALVELQEAEWFLQEKNTLDASKLSKLRRLDTWTNDSTLTIKGWKKPKR